MRAVFVPFMCTTSLVLVLQAVNSQTTPPRTCENTGPTCVEQCPDALDQYYQWCGSCSWYVACSEGLETFVPCATNLVFNEVVKLCASTSPVCSECYIHTPSPPPADVTAPSSTTKTPNVDAICQSTGPECVSSCKLTANGAYQWCGRCDYYLACEDGIAYYMACAPRRNWDNEQHKCVLRSDTCTECVDVGTDSTTHIDICTSGPCQNGGTCVTNGEQYVCICRPGYNGTNCQLTIDECASDPCLNDATCYDGDNRYICYCSPGFTGKNCESDVDECSSFPCLNGATCVDGENSFTCMCAPGFTDQLCSTLINECDSSPCDNNATCVNGINMFTCQCSPGFTGVTCQTDINECLSSPCQNNGTCVDSVNAYRCTCLPGFIGLTCQINNNECLSFPCQNNATCIDLVNEFTCSCLPGYSGTYCQIDDNECASSPCHNNATCIDEVNEFTCVCPPGFTGTLCQTNTDDCASSPCQNGATCVDGDNRYSCSCPPGFTGTNCQNEAPPPAPSNATVYLVYVTMTLNGTFYTNDVISDMTCVEQYAESFKDSLRGAVSDVSEIIAAGGLCVGASDVLLAAGTTKMVIYQNMGTIDFSVNVKPEDWLTFGSTESCAWDVSDFLRDFSHWRQPIIDEGLDCQPVTFNPSYFILENSEWNCAG